MSRKISDIQVLRALAVIFVIIHHVHLSLIPWRSSSLENFYAYFTGGIGVDLFLVISGFVISRNLLPALYSSENPNETLVDFWMKRFFRIIPSAWLWLLLTLICTATFNQSGAFGSFKSAFEGSVAAVLQVANIRFAACYGYFECGPTTIYWSLSLEEQFYLILPFLAIFSKNRLPIFLNLFILSQIFIPGLMLPSNFRATGIALGVLLACHCRSPEYRNLEPTYLGQNRLFANGLLLLLLVCLTTLLGQGLHIVSGNLAYNLAAIISAILVFIASFDKNYIVRCVPIKQIFVWVGDRSYALYLTHMPSFYLTREIFYRIAPELTEGRAALFYYAAMAVLIMLLLTEFSYRFIETPLQKKGAELLKRRRQQLATARTIIEAPHVQQATKTLSY